MTTLLDLWLNMCLVFITAAVFEYASLLYKKSTLNGKVDNAASVANSESALNAWGRKVDRMCCVGLFVSFSMVSAIFIIISLVRMSS